MNILIVDDNVIALELLRNALQQAGHTVRATRGGREAFDLIRGEEFSLVISDWENMCKPRNRGCAAGKSAGRAGEVKPLHQATTGLKASQTARLRLWRLERNRREEEKMPLLTFYDALFYRFDRDAA